MIVQDDEVMVSFDVVSLFTKIPVELALEVTQRKLMAWTEFENHTNWSIDDVLFVKDLKFAWNPRFYTFVATTINKFLELLWVHLFRQWLLT